MFLFTSVVSGPYGKDIFVIADFPRLYSLRDTYLRGKKSVHFSLYIYASCIHSFILQFILAYVRVLPVTGAR